MLKPLLKEAAMYNREAIEGTPVSLAFEDDSIGDGTNVDQTINLDTGKKVYVEVKRTERKFGSADSNVKKKEPNYYPEKYKKFYSKRVSKSLCK